MKKKYKYGTAYELIFEAIYKVYYTNKEKTKWKYTGEIVYDIGHDKSELLSTQLNQIIASSFMDCGFIKGKAIAMPEWSIIMDNITFEIFKSWCEADFGLTWSDYFKRVSANAATQHKGR